MSTLAFAVLISVLPRVAIPPVIIQVQVRVAQDASNRLLSVVIDGPEYWSHVEGLDGADARILHSFKPLFTVCGMYSARAEVLRSDGTHRFASTTFELQGCPESTTKSVDTRIYQ